MPDTKYLFDAGDTPDSLAGSYACRGLTAYSALKKAGPYNKDNSLVIVSAGGLGLLALKIAKAAYGISPIVVDIDDEKRPDILKYFIGKYGEDNVAQIGTYVAMQEKASLKDVARVFEVNFDKVNSVTKAIDGYRYNSLFDEEEYQTMLRDPNLGQTLRELVTKNPDWIKLSKRFEGTPNRKQKMFLLLSGLMEHIEKN